VNGKAIRKSNEESVKTMLRKLLTIMTEHGWPMPEVIAADQKQRKARLEELLKN
jgi:hypothetical protein